MSISLIVTSNRTRQLEAEAAESRLNDTYNSIALLTQYCSWKDFHPELQKSAATIQQLIQQRAIFSDLAPSFNPIIKNMEKQLQRAQAALKNKSIRTLEGDIDAFEKASDRSVSDLMASYEKDKADVEKLKTRINDIPKEQGDGLSQLQQKLQEISNYVEARIQSANFNFSSTGSSSGLLSYSSSSSSSSSSLSALLTMPASSSSSSSDPKTVAKRDVLYDLEEALVFHKLIDTVDDHGTECTFIILDCYNNMRSWTNSASMSLSDRVRHYYGSKTIVSATKLKEAIKCVSQEFAIEIFKQAITEKGIERAEKLCNDLLKHTGVLDAYTLNQTVAARRHNEVPAERALRCISKVLTQVQRQYTETL